MAILKVARMGHPVLRQVATPVDPESIPTAAVQGLIQDLLDTVDEYDGAGLAAPQVHASVRIVVLTLDPDAEMEKLLVDLHHEHKRRNFYSELEIARKRAALENVLVPESVAEHRARLERAGFAHSAVWLRYFNFVSIIAFR